MEKLTNILGLWALGICLVAFISIFGGTIIYWMWPVLRVPFAFLPELSWWQAVCLTWVANILQRDNKPTAK